MRTIRLLDRAPTNPIKEEADTSNYVPLACPDCERRRQQANAAYWRNREKKQKMARQYYHRKKVKAGG
jgi:hypothetical protein